MKTKLLAPLFALAAVLALVGCATPGIATASGKPEATITATPDAIKRALVKTWAGSGWNVDQDTAYSIRFTRSLKPGEDFAASMLVGNAYSTNSRAVTFTLVPDTATSTRVMATNTWLAQMPGGQVRQQDATGGKAATELQAHLLELKGVLEKNASEEKKPTA